VQILDELGRDPKAALQKHKEDPAVGSLLLTLSGLLGEHFEALGQQESPALPQGPLIDEALRKRAEASKIIDVTERTPGAWAREMAEQAAAEQVGTKKRHVSSFFVLGRLTYFPDPPAHRS